MRRVRASGWSAARSADAAGAEPAHGPQMARPTPRLRGGRGCSIAGRGRATCRCGSPRAGRPDCAPAPVPDERRGDRKPSSSCPTVAAELVRRGLTRPRRSRPNRQRAATSGPDPAIWCTSMSRSSPASTSPAIASPGPGAARTTASAGSVSTSASTTMPGLPMPRSWTTRLATAAAASSPGPLSGSRAMASAYVAS